MFKKVLLPVFMTFLITTVGLGKTNASNCVASSDTFPKISHVVIGNWNNVMDPFKGCVVLTDNNHLKIKAVFTFAINNLDSVPAIHFSTQFYDDINPVVHPRINSSDLTESQLISGDIIYTYTAAVYENSFSEECENPNNIISFDYNITLTLENGDPYPINDHPELFTFFNSANTGPEYSDIPDPSITYSGTKELCCEGYDVSGGSEGGYIQLPNDTETAANKVSDKAEDGASINDSGTSFNSLNQQAAQSFYEPIVSPNPFLDKINIKFKSLDSEVSFIELWDMNGKQIHYLEYIAESNGIQDVQINTNQLNPGLYFCRIKNNTQSYTAKVLKIQ